MYVYIYNYITIYVTFNNTTTVYACNMFFNYSNFRYLTIVCWCQPEPPARRVEFGYAKVSWPCAQPLRWPSNSGCSSETCGETRNLCSYVKLESIYIYTHYIYPIYSCIIDPNSICNFDTSPFIHTQFQKTASYTLLWCCPRLAIVATSDFSTETRWHLLPSRCVHHLLAHGKIKRIICTYIYMYIYIYMNHEHV